MPRFLIALLLAWSCLAQGADVSESSLDARVSHITEQLRCLVCQNESIAESQADLAKDLRRQVREMLTAGKSEKEVRDYMVERYGDFVLYDPPLQTSTLLLWLSPAALVILALGVFARTLVRRRKAPAATPDAAALAKARALLADPKDEK